MKVFSLRVSLAALAAALFLAVGCQQTDGPAGSEPKAAPAKAASTANLVCPITGNLIDPKAPTRQWEDRTVGFCSGNCPAAWDKLSDADKKTQFETAMNKQMSMVYNSKCPMKSNPISRAVPMRLFDGKIVGFCCPGCPRDWDNLTDAQKKAKLDAAMK